MGPTMGRAKSVETGSYRGGTLLHRIATQSNLIVEAPHIVDDPQSGSVLSHYITNPDQWVRFVRSSMVRLWSLSTSASAIGKATTEKALILLHKLISSSQKNNFRMLSNASATSIPHSSRDIASSTSA
jgi:hypothetical protein